jgi:hypothetical protein
MVDVGMEKVYLYFLSVPPVLAGGKTLIFLIPE